MKEQLNLLIFKENVKKLFMNKQQILKLKMK